MARNIARWDGISCQPLETGLAEYAALSLTIADSDLYVGGFFYLAGYQPVQNIAKWVLP